ARAQQIREKGSCRGRSHLDEPSAAETKQAIVKGRAASTALVVLVGLPVNTELAIFLDMIVYKNPFVAGTPLEASGQQQGDLSCNGQTFFRGATSGCCVGNIAVNLYPSQIGHGDSPDTI